MFCAGLPPGPHSTSAASAMAPDYAVWLDHWPVFLDGLDGLPHIGDRFEIDGEWWRVVKWTDRIICEREPS